jgi:hypothetical protein
MAQSRHAQRADECPLLGAKRTLTNRCLPISIYEFTTEERRDRFRLGFRFRRYREVRFTHLIMQLQKNKHWNEIVGTIFPLSHSTTLYEVSWSA